ncbi:MAG: biopolymer transporter ExbD [Polaromonas sp.]|nr:biopolymer transporter ExbD [Polaromonas sp.]
MKLYSQYLSANSGAAESDASPMVEMNTTPLIDVLLVLLVMLIITIPVQLHSVNLDMPSYQASTVEPEVVLVQMDAAGFLRWNAELVPDIASLNMRVATSAAMSVQPEIHLRPSSDTPYAFVAAFLVMAQKAGLTKVGVVN